MYTRDGFYPYYNYQLRKGNWKIFKVFTTLLISAIKKLNKMHPLKIGMHVYRGMKDYYHLPSAKSLYFKQFTSTTRNIGTAKDFTNGDGMIFTVKVNVNILAASVKDLSPFPKEDEILFSPFVALDFVNGTHSTMYFKTSDKQEFMIKKC